MASLSRTSLVVLAGPLALAGAGCMSPELGDYVFACGESSLCASGYACTDVDGRSLCVVAPDGPDGLDGPDAPDVPDVADEPDSGGPDGGDGDAATSTVCQGRETVDIGGRSWRAPCGDALMSRLDANEACEEMPGFRLPRVAEIMEGLDTCPADDTRESCRSTDCEVLPECLCTPLPEGCWHGDFPTACGLYWMVALGGCQHPAFDFDTGSPAPMPASGLARVICIAN